MTTPNGQITAEEGRLAENVLYFARTLRAAGLPVGPGKVHEALEAITAVGIGERRDFYWTLHSTFVNRRDQQEIFDQTFHLFWRNPKILDKLKGLLLPDVTADGLRDAAEQEISRRVADAFSPPRQTPKESQENAEEEIEVDASFTYSARERLQEMDFEKMSLDELEAAKRAIRALKLPLQEVKTRRFRAAPHGRRIDLRASLRASLRGGGDHIPLNWKEPRTRRPPLTVLCDISGSMARYSRMVLHFMHHLSNDRDRVHSFVFGTRLTNITRQLRYKDIDVALEKVGAEVEDWSGGTRIGGCLKDFNRQWSRRVLGQGAVVLLITDGLDREGARGVGEEMERLHKSCRRLIWLNPLLRYDAYAPKSQGASAMIGHVDELRSAHSINSLADLAAALSADPPAREEAASQWIGKSA